MKRPAFFAGVAFAIGASIVAGVGYAALAPLTGSATALQCVVAGLGLAYVLYLLASSPERVGRTIALAFWLVAAVATWFADPPFAIYSLVHLGLIWLVRSVYFYSSALCALADLALCALALAAAWWSGHQSGSVFFSVWSFFLTQALFVAIPAQIGRTTARARLAGGDSGTQFDHAHRTAQIALRALTRGRLNL